MFDKLEQRLGHFSVCFSFYVKVRADVPSAPDNVGEIKKRFGKIHVFWQLTELCPERTLALFLR